MTSRERLLAAYRCARPAELPIMVRGVRVWDEQWCRTRHASYAPVIEAVREYGDLQVGWGASAGALVTASDELVSERSVERGEDWNIITTVLHTPKGPLTQCYRESNRGLPGLRQEYFVKDLDDVERVLSVPHEPPEIDPTGFFQLRDQIGERGIVMCGFRAPISVVAVLLGSELLAIWSVQRRDVIRKLLDTFTERTLDHVQRLLDAGIGPIFSSNGEEYAAPPLHGPRDFREFVVQPQQLIFERIHRRGGLIHTHCHGPLDTVLEDFVDLGSDVLHPLEAPPLGNVTMEDAVARIGGEICIEGNIQIGDIYAGPTETLVEQVKHNIDMAAPSGGYVLAPTASPHTEVLEERTVKNYVRMIETAVEYGR